MRERLFMCRTTSRDGRHPNPLQENVWGRGAKNRPRKVCAGVDKVHGGLELIENLIKYEKGARTCKCPICTVRILERPLTPVKNLVISA